MVVAFERFGLDGRLPPSHLTVDPPLDDRLACCAAMEEVVGGMLNATAVAEGVVSTPNLLTATAGKNQRSSIPHGDAFEERHLDAREDADRGAANNADSRVKSGQLIE